MRAILLLPLLLAGCATSKATYTQDGRQGHSISCSGTMNSWDTCYQKAGELCGARGYDILHKDGDQGAAFNATPQYAAGSTIITRSLVIACR